MELILGHIQIENQLCILVLLIALAPAMADWSFHKRQLKLVQEDLSDDYHGTKKARPNVDPNIGFHGQTKTPTHETSGQQIDEEICFGMVRPSGTLYVFGGG